MALQTLEAFMKGTGRGNAYVTFPGFKGLYIRRNPRFIRNLDIIAEPTIDIANLTAKKPGKGAFTHLFQHLRKEYPHLWIFVECVVNERFAAKLLRMGFVQCTDDFAPSFYMPPEKPHEVHRIDEES